MIFLLVFPYYPRPVGQQHCRHSVSNTGAISKSFLGQPKRKLLTSFIVAVHATQSVGSAGLLLVFAERR